jgi:hypothetical protein
MERFIRANPHILNNKTLTHSEWLPWCWLEVKAGPASRVVKAVVPFLQAKLGCAADDARGKADHRPPADAESRLLLQAAKAVPTKAPRAVASASNVGPSATP